jgi:hypothetical protein
MQTKFTASIVLLFVVLLTSCMGNVKGSSDTPAASLKNVHTDRQGPDSFVVFFTLRDNAMADTISDGKATIEIIQTPYMSNKGGLTVLFNKTQIVQKADFKESPLGYRYYSFGPISNSQFGELNPMGANYAIVNIYFITPDNRVLSSQCNLPIPL